MPAPLFEGQTNPPAMRSRLSLELAMDVVLCGLLLIGGSLAGHWSQQAFPRLALFTGFVGGGLCLVLGVVGRRAGGCHAGAMVTLAVVTLVAGYEFVLFWVTRVEADASGQMLMPMMTLWFVVCLGTTINLFQEWKRERH